MTFYNIFHVINDKYHLIVKLSTPVEQNVFWILGALIIAWNTHIQDFSHHAINLSAPFICASQRTILNNGSKFVFQPVPSLNGNRRLSYSGCSSDKEARQGSAAFFRESLDNVINLLLAAVNIGFLFW